MRQVSYFLEAAGVWLALTIFRLLPANKASNFGGCIGRTLGTRLAASRKAYKNLERALPGKTDAEYQTIVTDMWDNLGRVMAEYPHLLEIINKAEIVGRENLENLPDSFVIASSHTSNWETTGFLFNHHLNIPVKLIYRAPNNPFVARILDKCRNPKGGNHYVPKSTAGTRALVTEMKEGGRTTILIDQKYNEGIRANFFGHPAMTSTAFVQLARRYNSPILPVWPERVNGTGVRFMIEAPIYVGDRTDEEVIAQVHGLLERHILKNPGQWLWLHRRWIT